MTMNGKKRGKVVGYIMLLLLFKFHVEALKMVEECIHHKIWKRGQLVVLPNEQQ